MPSGANRSLDLVAVLVVVVGEAAQVAARDADEARGLGDRELVVGVAERSKILGVDASVPCPGAPGQLAGATPTGTISFVDRNKLRITAWRAKVGSYAYNSVDPDTLKKKT